MAAMGAGAQDEALGRLIEDVRTLGANTVMIMPMPRSRPPTPPGDVFPTAL
jgi:uncharacterized protein YbjQ (UPF0145 family)